MGKLFLIGALCSIVAGTYFVPKHGEATLRFPAEFAMERAANADAAMTPDSGTSGVGFEDDAK